ncbi:MAG TPA: hypothetical protein VF778_14660, partial [Xanthobacteraceae bacterium]
QKNHLLAASIVSQSLTRRGVLQFCIIEVSQQTYTGLGKFSSECSTAAIEDLLPLMQGMQLQIEIKTAGPDHENFLVVIWDCRCAVLHVSSVGGRSCADRSADVELHDGHDGL